MTEQPKPRVVQDHTPGSRPYAEAEANRIARLAERFRLPLMGGETTQEAVRIVYVHERRLSELLERLESWEKNRRSPDEDQS